MKYSRYPRCFYKPKKGASALIRRIVQRHLDRIYFETDHTALEQAQLDAMIYGTAQIKVFWDEVTEQVVVE